MIKTANLSLIVVLVFSGCSLIPESEPAPQDRILGSLELHLDLTSELQDEDRFIQTTVNMRLREWPGMQPDGRSRPCTYHLKRRRLHLELVDETIHGGPYVIRNTIVINGDFQRRSKDTIAGPFRGTATHRILHRHYSAERQEWVETTEEKWEGAVTGHCLLNGKRVIVLKIGSGPGGSDSLSPRRDDPIPLHSAVYVIL